MPEPCLSVQVRIHVLLLEDIGAAPTSVEAPAVIAAVLPKHEPLDVAPDTPDWLLGEAPPTSLVHAILQEEMLPAGGLVGWEVIGRQSLPSRVRGGVRVCTSDLPIFLLESGECLGIAG